MLQDGQRGHVWNLEGFYALVLFSTIFLIITTCLMVICDDRNHSSLTHVYHTRLLQRGGSSSGGRSRGGTSALLKVGVRRALLPPGHQGAALRVQTALRGPSNGEQLWFSVASRFCTD